LGIPFTVIRPTYGPDGREIDETVLPGETPAEVVYRLSRLKARAVLDNLPPLPELPFSPPISAAAGHKVIIIAADTDVALENEILGKPGSPAEATLMLQRLRQQCHDVYSGVTVVAASPAGKAGSEILATRIHRSLVWMRPYTDAEIAAYVATGSPLDKAGAYGIQDDPFNPVERLEGCFASVMGLPLGELAAALQEIGVELAAVGPACSRYTGQSCCQVLELTFSPKPV
jgi:MAF protein